MPRREKQTTVHPPSHTIETAIPRMSYTGPLMPRPTPIQSSNPSFMQTVKEGFSFGVGTSIARNLVDRMFGSSKSGESVTSIPTSTSAPVYTKPIPTGSIEPIGEDQRLYHKCMQEGDSKSLARHEYCKNFIL